MKVVILLIDRIDYQTITPKKHGAVFCVCVGRIIWHLQRKMTSDLAVRDQCDTAFNPIMEAMSVAMKKRRQKLAGSLKTKIPIMAVPTAPIPVQTA